MKIIEARHVHIDPLILEIHHKSIQKCQDDGSEQKSSGMLCFFVLLTENKHHHVITFIL